MTPADFRSATAECPCLCREDHECSRCSALRIMEETYPGQLDGSDWFCIGLGLGVTVTLAVTLLVINLAR